MSGYWTQVRYIGAGGVELELSHNDRDAWHFRFLTSPVWYFGGRSKFDAILAASHRCGKSAEAMQWEPAQAVSA